MYIAALVIGIFSFVVGLMPFIGWLAVPMSIVAIVMGIIGINKKESITGGEYQMSLAAVILGALPILVKMLIWM